MNSEINVRIYEFIHEFKNNSVLIKSCLDIHTQRYVFIVIHFIIEYILIYHFLIKPLCDW